MSERIIQSILQRSSAGKISRLISILQQIGMLIETSRFFPRKISNIIDVHGDRQCPRSQSLRSLESNINTAHRTMYLSSTTQSPLLKEATQYHPGILAVISNLRQANSSSTQSSRSQHRVQTSTPETKPPPSPSPIGSTSKPLHTQNSNHTKALSLSRQSPLLHSSCRRRSNPRPRHPRCSRHTTLL